MGRSGSTRAGMLSGRTRRTGTAMLQIPSGAATRTGMPHSPRGMRRIGMPQGPSGTRTSIGMPQASSSGTVTRTSPSGVDGRHRRCPETHGPHGRVQVPCLPIPKKQMRWLMCWWSHSQRRSPSKMRGQSWHAPSPRRGPALTLMALPRGQESQSPCQL